MKTFSFNIYFLSGYRFLPKFWHFWMG